MQAFKSISLAAQVFDRLENEILSGKYPRGTVLSELTLCADLGVSRTPVREALSRLQQEHIIEMTDRGLVVVSITIEDVETIYAIRAAIEWMAAAACARKITQEQIADLKEIIDLQEFYTVRGEAERVRQLDNDFHERIYRYCGSTVLFDTLLPLHKKIQKYRRASLEKHDRAVQAAAEHSALYRAIAAHDPDLAAQSMKQHIENARQHMRMMAQQQQES